MVVSFSQMFFTLMVPDTCINKDVASRDCDQSEYYLKVYAVLLGEFGTFRRDSLSSAFTVVLLIIYSFMVVLILLNILIAVASDSYEKCLVRSQNLFGRARVMMIAELVLFQNLLRGREGGKVSCTSLHKLGFPEKFLSSPQTGSAVFFMFSTAAFMTWTTAEVVTSIAGTQYANLYFTLGSILVNGVLYLGMLVYLSLAASDRYGDRKEQTASDGLFQRMMLRLLGSSCRSDNDDDLDENWRGRLVYLKDEMARLADSASAQAHEQVKALQRSFIGAEEKMQAQMSSLTKELGDIRTMVAELKSADKNGSNGNNDTVGSSMVDIQLALQHILMEMQAGKQG
jgi:hypothetical protein